MTIPIKVGELVVRKPGGGFVMHAVKQEGDRFFCVSVDRAKAIQCWFDASELLRVPRRPISVSF
jgi:hypothetical protein